MQLKPYLMKNMKIGFQARWKLFLTDLGILEDNIDHLIIMERYLTERGAVYIVNPRHLHNARLRSEPKFV